MATLRQIQANRRNAQKSTGHTSVTGKAVSSMNALKTGIHAKSLVLPSENPAELEELIEDCYPSFNPTTHLHQSPIRLAHPRRPFHFQPLPLKLASFRQPPSPLHRSRFRRTPYVPPPPFELASFRNP
jgi:hypothetical protein